MKKLWNKAKQGAKKLVAKGKKVAAGAVLTGALMFGSSAEAAEPKTSLSLSEIASFGQIPILRLESYTSGLPGNSDFYNVWENQDDNDFYLSRLQTFPLKYKNFGLGLVAQHIDGTNFDAHDELGLATMFFGKPTKSSFAKGTLRYFPTRDMLSGYGILDTKKIFADLVASYNTKSKNASFTLGVDFKLPSDWYLGLEIKMSGRFGDLKKNSVGLRLRKNF